MMTFEEALKLIQDTLYYRENLSVGEMMDLEELIEDHIKKATA